MENIYISTCHNDDIAVVKENQNASRRCNFITFLLKFTGYKFKLSGYIDERQVWPIKSNK